MPPKPSSPASAPQSSFARKATITVVILTVLTLVYQFLDSHLDWFYILNPTDLHDLSLRAISAHGNDTARVVSFITSELSEKFPGGYINLDEEWIFNNAGGAMGAMYIIHASMSLPPPSSLPSNPLLEYLLPSSISSHFKWSHDETARSPGPC
jgi:C-8 sterol isomerase